MKHISFLLLLFSILTAAVNFAIADDFYYTGSPSYNPYNGYTVMSLPPPPPMSSVPFYDYYKCILGYEYKGLTCRYWRNYAEKNGFYQKTAPAQNSNVQQNNAAAPANTQTDNKASGHKMLEPYTPQH